jgi:hypothetical protein
MKGGIKMEFCMWLVVVNYYSPIIEEFFDEQEAQNAYNKYCDLFNGKCTVYLTGVIKSD